jgi:hypothetical protein
MTETVVKQDPRRKRKPGDKANGNGVDPGMDPFQNGLAGINRIVMVEMIVAHEVLLTFRPDLGAATRLPDAWNPALLRVQDKNRRLLPMFHQNSAGIAEPSCVQVSFAKPAERANTPRTNKIGRRHHDEQAC